MTNEDAKQKLDFLKKAYQKLIDEKVDSGKLVGDGIRGEWKAETSLDDVYRDMIEALDMAIKALEQTKWIPTSEKPTEGKYLITGAYGKNRYVDIATFDGEDATDTYAWDSYSDEYKVNRREHKVIAYMPLPEPYNAESEK